MRRRLRWQGTGPERESTDCLMTLVLSASTRCARTIPIVQILLAATKSFKSFSRLGFFNQRLGLAALHAHGEIRFAQLAHSLGSLFDRGDEPFRLPPGPARLFDTGEAVGQFSALHAGSDKPASSAFPIDCVLLSALQDVQLGEGGFEC